MTTGDRDYTRDNHPSNCSCLDCVSKRIRERKALAKKDSPNWESTPPRSTTYRGKSRGLLLGWSLKGAIVFALLIFGAAGWLLWRNQIIAYFNFLSPGFSQAVTELLTQSSPTNVTSSTPTAPSAEPTPALQPRESSHESTITPPPKIPKIEPEPELLPKPGSTVILAGISFSEIDQHALNAPESVTNSIKSLAAYLAEPAINDFEKARAIFSWIAENISYDANSYFSGIYSSATPQDVLRTRSSVCQGYSNLFETLARAAGLEVITISGFAKGYGYKVGDHIVGDTNHAWNAVKIEDGWYLVDCTWGAGSLDSSEQFVRDFTPHYFGTPPESFIYDHLPEDPKWQLLESSIDKAEFQKSPIVNSQFFAHGLEIDSHTTSVITTIHDIEITCLTLGDTQVISELSISDVKLPDILTFVQQLNNKYYIYAHFPEAGTYFLDIFTKKPGDESYWPALQYKVEVSEGIEGISGFPEAYGQFTEGNVFLYNPMKYYLDVGGTEHFMLKVPDAEEVAVIMSEQWRHLKKDGDIFKGDAKILWGKVEISAKYPGNEAFDILLVYRGQ